MIPLRLLTVTFDVELEPWEVPAFRGAVAEKVGLEHHWFHNHNNDPESSQGFIYRYPLIQYKLDRHKHPMLVYIGEGVDEAFRFFTKPNWTIKIGEKQYELKILRLHLDQYRVGIWEKHFKYSLRNWIALNTEHYKEYKAIQGVAEQVQYLERKLTNSILGFAAGIDWRVEGTIEAKILEMRPNKVINYKGVKMECFSLDFSTNVSLPPFIGLGKGSSVGHGTVW